MTPLISTYIDVIRLGAAVVVALNHGWPLVAPTLRVPWPGHHAVIVFFVISGFVIKHVTATRHDRAGVFLFDRLTRLWSVAVPALILAALIWYLVPATRAAHPEFTQAGPLEFLWASCANLVFMGQSWWTTIPAPLNWPFWSLSYEAWYYVIFACWTFGRGWRRYGLLALSSAMAGPKILLLMPCWLAGVWLYTHMPAMRPKTAVLAFIGTIVAYVLFLHADTHAVIREAMIAAWPGMPGWTGASSSFVGDYVLTAIVSANIAAVASFGRHGGILLRFRKQIGNAASYTFSIYLYHMPLLLLASAGLGLTPVWLALTTTLAILALGHVTERRLPAFRRACAGLLRRPQLAVRERPAPHPQQARH